jgi:hypothetical protein
MHAVEAVEAVADVEAEEEADEGVELRVREMVRVVKWLFSPRGTRFADIPLDALGGFRVD